MRRILFVDDEPAILDAIAAMLSGQRGHWDMALVSRGEDALRELASAPFDVIVADMRMPGMDGAALLTEVRDRFPNVVRMILTGHASLDTTLRAVPVAHQFLIKPCDPSMIRVVVERACSLKDMLASDLLRSTVGATQELPPLPRTYAALTRALADPNASLEQVAKIIGQDMAISAKIIQLVNSPLIGLSERVSTIKTAVSYLGITTLKNLVLSLESFRAFQGREQVPGFSSKDLNSHAFLAARIAARLPTEGHLRDAAHVAALLHDVGKLILAAKLPEHFQRVVAGMQEEHLPMHAVEQKLIGVTHAEIGAYLLGLWGLPYPIIEAVAYHHAPTQGLDTLAAVYVAHILAHENEPKPAGDAPAVSATFDSNYLQALGVENQLPKWRSIAAEVARTMA